LESEYHSQLINVLSGTSVNNPDLDLITWLIALAALLFLSALMSASEAAYFSLDSDEVKKLRSDTRKSGKLALMLHSNPEKLLGTIKAVRNTVNIVFVFIAAFLSIRLCNPADGHHAGFILIVAAAAFLLLFPGEAIPNAYAAANRTAVALFTAIPLSLLQKLFLPVTFLSSYSSYAVKKRMGNARASELPSSLELNSDNPDEDQKILKGIANFGNINVSAIMCPRMDVTAIDIRTGFDKIIPVIIESGFSRIPVYSGSFDTVKGILYAKDVLPYTGNPPGFKWQSLLRPSYFVPETKKINDLLKEFQLRKIHMAVVIDEYGGTSGIVTLEDILEAIVGEITDESDEDEILFRKIDDNSYIFEGKILLDDFCEIVGIDEALFSEVRGESETLAGLMLELAGEIPQKDRIINFSNFIFRIESVDRRRIKQIHVQIKKSNKDSDE